MRIYMQTPHIPEQPLRFYHLHLQQDLLGGWTLVRESGLQGKRGTVKQAHFDNREEAERALSKFRDSQLKRGYRIVFSKGAMQEEA